jgi:hypothetical protein
MGNSTNINKWQEISDRIPYVFTPRSPISRRELFVGRIDQIGKLLDAINQPGAHAIVYGERGVGKTSLVTILPELLEQQKRAGYVFSKTQCDVNDTFATLCKKLFSNLIVTKNNVVIDKRQTKLDLPDTLDLWLNENPTPDDIRRLIPVMGGRHLIAIIDEFDTVANKKEVANLLANTIKTLSDNLIPATIIVVGVADTVAGLIAEHASIERCVIEIHMPRMSVNEMYEFINIGIKEIDMTIEKIALEHICQIAQGLPSYVHLLCRESALVASIKKETQINKEHTTLGLERALGNVPGILIQDWTKATASPKSNNLFKQVLFACAFAHKNELGFFSAKNVQEPFSRITGKHYEIPGYGGSLHLLTEERRACILEKKGESHRWQYRFRNPLMEPYVIMWGLKNKSIGEELVQEFKQKA